MKKEWSDMELAIEISRNPQMRMELQRMVAEQIAAVNQPQLTEGDGGAGVGAEQRQPASAPGVPQQAPTSGEGAVALKGFRGT